MRPGTALPRDQTCAPCIASAESYSPGKSNWNLLCFREMAPEQATPGLIMLCFIVLHTYFIFFLNKLKVCGDLLLSKSVGTIFPTAFVHFLSLCHILAILAIFQNFSLLLYLLWWSRDH